MKEFLIFFVNASKNPPKGDEKSGINYEYRPHTEKITSTVI